MPRSSARVEFLHQNSNAAMVCGTEVYKCCIFQDVGLPELQCGLPPPTQINPFSCVSASASASASAFAFAFAFASAFAFAFAAAFVLLRKIPFTNSPEV